MPTFKIHKRNDFTCIANKLLRDKDLSNQAIGLMCKMLSLPPDWNYSIKGLVAICKDGQCKITSALQELKDNGYLAIVPIRESGKIVRWEYHIYEDKDLSIKDDTTIENTCDDDVEQSDETEASNNSNNADVKVETDRKNIPVANKESNKPKKAGAYQKEIEIVVDYLNEVAGKHFTCTTENSRAIRKWLKNHYTVDDLKAVVDVKTKAWMNSPMWAYLRPITLFGDKFEGYLSECNPPTRTNKSKYSGTYRNDVQAGIGPDVVPWATDYYTQKRPTEFGTVFA